MHRYAHHILLGITVALVVVGTYVVSAYSAPLGTPKVIWTSNPITISFSHVQGSASATDSFKCAPPLSGTVVLTSSNSILSVSPAGFPSCGPSFTNSVTLKAQTTTIGTYHVTVTASQLSLYKIIQPSLSVTIVVT